MKPRRKPVRSAERTVANSSPRMDESTLNSSRGDFNWTLVISILGLSLSLIALTQSCEQTSISKKLPFEAALYQTRVLSMQSYARAHYGLDNQLRATMVDIPFDVYSAQDIENTSDFAMQQNAIIAQKFRDRHAAYVAEVNTNMGLWPVPIQNKVIEVGFLASVASQCFLQLGGKTLTNGTHSREHHRVVWQEVRMKATEPCDGLNVKHPENPIVKFQLGGAEALHAMAVNLRETQNDLVPSVE